MKIHAQRRGEQTWRRKWRDEGVMAGLSALSSILVFPLYSLLASVSWVLSLCLRPSLSLLVFRSLSSLFSFVFFFLYSHVHPPCLCVFLFFTLYPFSFPSSPLSFFFSSSSVFFSSPVLPCSLCFFFSPCSPILSLVLCVFLLLSFTPSLFFSFSCLPPFVSPRMLCFWCNGCWRWSFGTATEEEVEGVPFVFQSYSFVPLWISLLSSPLFLFSCVFFCFSPACVRSFLWLLWPENACVFPDNKDMQDRYFRSNGNGWRWQGRLFFLWLYSRINAIRFSKVLHCGQLRLIVSSFSCWNGFPGVIKKVMNSLLWNGTVLRCEMTIFSLVTQVLKFCS